jgi:DNA-binding transcriptional LysR family regulator
MHARHLDLNLLRVFRALLFEKSVTRAAATLGLTQPAVSHALTRLREAYEDPLFLRVRRSMEPTPRALELSALICESLDRIECTLEHRFELKRLNQAFRIAFIDFGGIFFLPSLMSRLSLEAPGVKVLPEYMDNAAGSRRLRDSEVDFGIGLIRENSAPWRRIRLFDDPFVIAMRKSHPIKGSFASLEQLNRHKYVRIPYFDCFEPLLEKQGLVRRFAATAENFLPIPFIISRTDLVGLIPQSVFTVFKQICNLRSVESKLTLPPFSLELVFDHRKEISPADRWLVNCITDVASEVAGDLMLDQNWEERNSAMRPEYFAENRRPTRYDQKLVTNSTRIL